MAGEATLEDVLEAKLIDPNGIEYRVISQTTNRRSGTQQDMVSVQIEATSRFKELLEFDGSFVTVRPGNFARSVLPKPGAGRSLSSAGWSLTVSPVNEEAFKIEPLILVEATVEQANLADGATGPFRPDAGQDRLEILNLSLSDARILWREMGHVAGRRNFRERQNLLRIRIEKESTVLEIKAPVVRNVDGEPGAIKLDDPVTVEIPVDSVEETFDPLSLSSLALRSVKQLLQEVTDRLPFLTEWPDGSLIGPPEIVSQLVKLFIFDLDYSEEGRSGSEVIDQIAAKAGLIVGLQLDGRFFVEFDAVPSEAQFKASGIVGRFRQFTAEPRSARVRPRSPLVRVYPSRVIKEIAVSDFIEVVKDQNGNIVPIGDFAARIGLKDSVDHLAYLMAVKAGVDFVGRKDELEDTFKKTPAGLKEGQIQQNTATTFVIGSAVSSDEKQAAIDDARNLADHVHRGFQHKPSAERIASIRLFANAAREQGRFAFAERARIIKELGKGGKSIDEAKVAGFEFNAAAMLDVMLLTPFRIVTKVDEVGELAPRFFTDLILHREYDFIAAATTISLASFERDPDKVGVDDFGFRQGPFSSLVRVTGYFGKALGKKGPNLGAPGRTPPSCPILGNRTLERRPVDWPESAQKVPTLQARFSAFAGKRDGTMPANLIEQFWIEKIGGFVTGFTVVPDSPPLEVLVTWISGDATQHVKTFDPQTGFVLFDVPVGLFRGTVSMRNFLEGGRTELRRAARERELEIVDGGFPPQPEDATQAQCTLARHIDLILSDDARNSEIATTRIDTDEDLPDAEFFPFSEVLDAITERSVGFPLWQVASLKDATEIAAKQRPPSDSPDVSIVLDEAEEDLPDVSELPAIPSGMVVPGAGESGPAVAVPAPGGGAGSTETVSESSTPGPSETTNSKLADPKEKRPELVGPPVVARFYVEVPFEESAWPRVEIGEKGPARTEQVNVPWIEDLGGTVFTRTEFTQAAKERFAEVNAESTIEESEEIEIAGVFGVELGSLVRNITITFEEGGSRPRTNVISSGLISKKFPFMRALLATIDKTKAEKRGNN